MFEDKKVHEKLDKIIHDLQQIKTSQRASQKRERKTVKLVDDGSIDRP